MVSIENVDHTLSAQRLEWLKARNPSERREALKRINESLDKRLELMRVRDWK